MTSNAAPHHRLIGRTAPEWNVTHWINSDPLTLEGLRDKVVLVRWWTAPGCPYCRNTAPSLNEFHRRYQKDGLQVIGFYHHKSASPLHQAQVEGLARNFDFKFPVAIDPHWQTLQKWWLEPAGTNWTSVTFLLDRHGVIRHIHPGGQYVKGDGDYELLEQAIEELLGESGN